MDSDCDLRGIMQACNNSNKRTIYNRLKFNIRKAKRPRCECRKFFPRIPSVAAGTRRVIYYIIIHGFTAKMVAVTVSSKTILHAQGRIYLVLVKIRIIFSLYTTRVYDQRLCVNIFSYF